jgi:hypothetical protein
MSYERLLGGFAGHNVDRRLWVEMRHSRFARAVNAYALKRSFTA